MFKKLALSTVTLLAMAPFVASVVPQVSVSADTTRMSQITPSSVSDLHMLTEEGFATFPGTDRIATFDSSTNTIVYQNDISWINPGGTVYTTNELVGVKKDGTKVKLTSGSVVGSSFSGDIMRYTYQLDQAEKEAYTYYEVNVEFHDNVWGETGSAHASFTIA